MVFRRSKQRTQAPLSLDALLNNLFLPVYQNENFIRGLYEVIRGGNVDEILAESEDRGSRDLSGKGTGSFAVGGGKIPFMSQFSLPKVETELDGGVSINNHQSKKLTQKTTFSNSYKLAFVLEQLRTKQKLKKVNSLNDINDLQLGDFVEYAAFFAKNEISELLEFFKDDLITALGKTDLVTMWLRLTVNEQLKKQPTNNLVIDQPMFDQLVDLTKQAILSLAHDFKGDSTTDFYGDIIDSASNKVGIKNIVICDDQFFSNGDSQRILDGNFKVVGKVAKIQKRNPGGATTLSTQNIYESLSQLDRNKLLKRITPQALETFDAGLKRVLDKIKMSTDFDLIIKGEAIKVIPIAIYI